MAWDRIGFVVIEGFFCFLVVLPGLVSHLRRAGFADWMPMHPWMDQDGVFKTDIAWCIVGEKQKLRFILYHGNDDPCWSTVLGLFSRVLDAVAALVGDCVHRKTNMLFWNVCFPRNIGCVYTSCTHLLNPNWLAFISSKFFWCRVSSTELYQEAFVPQWLFHWAIPESSMLVLGVVQIDQQRLQKIDKDSWSPIIQTSLMFSARVFFPVQNTRTIWIYWTTPWWLSAG